MLDDVLVDFLMSCVCVWLVVMIGYVLGGCGG